MARHAGTDVGLRHRRATGGAVAMDHYAGVLEEAVDGTRQQERHYQLLSALQSLVKELPRCAAGGGQGVGLGGERPG